MISLISFSIPRLITIDFYLFFNHFLVIYLFSDVIVIFDKKNLPSRNESVNICEIMHRKTILLIEDNLNDIKLTERALIKSEFSDKIELFVVKDGIDAVEYLFGNKKSRKPESRMNPDLILLDLNLPKMNGFEVLERINQDKSVRLIPLIVLTSSKEDDDLIRAYKLGVNSYIRKPIDFNKFTDVIKEICSYWIGLNETMPL